jgi:Flp pilus assembly protein TadG
MRLLRPLLPRITKYRPPASRCLRRFHGARRRSEGQILAMFAGGAILLILITGLVIDGGNVFLQRRDSQNSADIGAMAGTKRLADYYVLPTGSAGKAFTGTDNVYTKIATRMGQNDCSSALGSDCSWTARYVGPRSGSTFIDLGPVGPGDAVPPTVNGQKALGVSVNVTRTPRTYLLGVVGQSTWTVRTVATALTTKLSDAPAGQILPIALTSMPTQEGAIYALTSGANGPGNFGWISWDGSNNAGALATSVCTPNNPAFALPREFTGDPGKTNASDVRDCLQTWVDNQQVVLIPIVEATGDDPSNTNGCDTGSNGNNFTYCVTGLAAFVITGFSQPAVDQINGRFIGTIPYSVGGNTNVPAGPTAAPDEGSTLYTLGLAQ